MRYNNNNSFSRYSNNNCSCGGCTGPMGPMGATGATGPTGPTGSTGASAAEAIIPYASGSTIDLTTIAGGLAGAFSTLGFGSSVASSTPLGGIITETNMTSFAFSAPRDGTLTAISGFFSATSALSLIGTDIIIKMQVYESTVPNNTFTPIAATSLNLPALTGIISIGQVISGSLNGLSVPVIANHRYLLVVSASATGASLINIIAGYASAGITIA